MMYRTYKHYHALELYKQETENYYKPQFPYL